MNAQLQTQEIGDTAISALAPPEMAGAYGSDSWTRGGTGYTNFDPRDFHIYREAIQRHGDPLLYIGKPMFPGITKDFALRRRERISDLTIFWGVFGDVRKEHEEAMATARAAA